MKKRKINKELYPTKWEELIKKFPEEEAIEEYWKFSRTFSLEKYILKFGEEEGKIKFEEKRGNRRYGMSLENCIKKHGEKKGEEVYNKWTQDVSGSLDNFIRRHGEEEGRKKYDEFRNNCIVKQKYKDDPNSKFNNRSINTRLDFYTDKGYTEKEAKELLKKRQTTSRLDDFIKKYGEEYGKKKYIETNKKKALTLENFIKKHGEIHGPEKYQKWIEKIKFANTEEEMIKKHGEEGYYEILRKKAEGSKMSFSKISIKLFDIIHLKIKDKFDKIYYGENEYFFYIHSDEFKIAKPDFYIKDINLAIEFYGDFWHKNPSVEKYKDKKFNDVRKKDKRRIKIVKQKFNTEFMIVWEYDFVNNPKKVINKILKKIKKYDGRNN